MAYLDVVSGKEINELPQEGVTLVDIWAPWCGPCRMIGPIVERIAEKADGKYNVIKIEADSNREILEEYNVRSIPTIIFLKDGKEVWRTVGLKKQEELEKILSDWNEL